MDPFDDLPETSPPSDDVPPTPAPPPPEGFLVKVEHVLLVIVVIALIVYLGGSSERGVIKLVERDALKNGKMPNSFFYGTMQVVNSLTLGLMGLVMNVALDDPFAGVPIVREGGRAADVHFSPTTK